MPPNPDPAEDTRPTGGAGSSEAVPNQSAGNAELSEEPSGGAASSESFPSSDAASTEVAVEEPLYALGTSVTSTEEETPAWNASDSTGGGGDSGGGGGDDSSGGDEESEPHEMARMSFFDHLEELRKRIFYSLLAVAAGMAISWGYADEIYAGLARPLTNVLRELKLPDKLVYTNPTGPFNLYVKLAMIAGLFLSSPFLIYQAWSFISPGLYKNEKKYAMPFVLFCSTLFISGGAFAYFIAFPAALHFLLNFGSQFQPFITVDEYFSLASTIILGLAIVFELPVLILFLTLLHIVTPGFLLRNFRYAFLVIIIIAAAVTPTSDIVNMMIFAAPLVALYFLGVGLSYLVLKARQRKKADA